MGRCVMPTKLVSCKICEKETPNLGTQLCDPCWHARNAVRHNKDAVLKILGIKQIAVVNHVGSSWGTGEDDPTVIVTNSCDYTKIRDKGTKLYIMETPDE
jgi:hypothetical protein